MCLGITMSLLNGLHHHSAIDIIAEFVPQILFMLSLFGYMVFLIFLKWGIDWTTRSNQPPLLLNVMISMFLSITDVSEENKLFDGQVCLTNPPSPPLPSLSSASFPLTFLTVVNNQCC